MAIEKHHLTDEQIEITQNCGTEPPFSGELLNEKRKGTYICVVCKDELFNSDTVNNSEEEFTSFEKNESSEEVEDELEIPAFLRRQKN